MLLAKKCRDRVSQLAGSVSNNKGFSLYLDSGQDTEKFSLENSYSYKCYKNPQIKVGGKSVKP